MSTVTRATSAVPTLGLPGQVISAVQRTVRIIEHELMAKNTYRLRLECPDIAKQILPGQFFMIRLPHGSDPLLGRPFALFDIATDASGQPIGLDLGYVVVGKLTGRLAECRNGDQLELWGPLGNGFALPTGERHLVCVAGGIGQTPFLAVIREALGLQTYGQPARIIGEHPRRISMLYGVRNADYLAGVHEFRHTGCEVRLATDDGSAGHHGYVTQLLSQLIASDDPPSRVLTCGPEPMMRAVAAITTAAGIPCDVSLETPMACGIGACFSCVAKIRQPDGTWDYRRVCVEGPVFPADQVEFDDSHGG